MKWIQELFEAWRVNEFVRKNVRSTKNNNKTMMIICTVWISNHCFLQIWLPSTFFYRESLGIVRWKEIHCLCGCHSRNWHPFWYFCKSLIKKWHWKIHKIYNNHLPFVLLWGIWSYSLDHFLLVHMNFSTQLSRPEFVLEL